MTSVGELVGAVDVLSSLCDSEDPVITAMLVQYAPAIVQACKRRRLQIRNLTVLDCYLNSLPPQEKMNLEKKFGHLFTIIKQPPSNISLILQQNLKELQKTILSTTNPNPYAQSVYNSISKLVKC
jgi:hypothetical protein